MKMLIITLIYALFTMALIWYSPDDLELILLINFIEFISVSRFAIKYHQRVHDPIEELSEIPVPHREKNPVSPVLRFLLKEVRFGYPKPWVLLWGTISCQLYLVFALLITGLPSSWLTLILYVTGSVMFARLIATELYFGFIRVQE